MLKTNQEQQYIVIVDAYSSASQIAPALHKYDYKTIHLQTRKEVFSCFAESFRSQDFCKNILFETEELTLNALKTFNISHVLSGAECGVIIAERLAALLDCPTNNYRTSSIRRDKFEMIAELHKHNIPAARQRLCKIREDAYSFALEENGPVVLKPLNSSGSDGIMFCAKPRDAAKAFDELSGRCTIYGDKINEVVIQSYLDGREYYVNTVSLNGVHHISDFWQITHIAVNGLLNMQDSSMLLPSEGEIQKSLAKYAFKCLDALGVENGAAHLEIKYGSDGPKLIELGARLCGGPLGRVASRVLKENQLSTLIKSLLNPDSFLKEAGRPYATTGVVAVTALISPKSGKLQSYPKLEKLKSLESFEEIIEICPEGGNLQATIDDITYPMMVVLKNQDPAALERDSRTVRYIDGESFYEMAN